MIPEAAVEAAARVNYGLCGGRWEAITPELREEEIADMRLILEAAAPHMLAVAWDEGRSSANILLPSNPPKSPTNPYRSRA